MLWCLWQVREFLDLPDRPNLYTTDFYSILVPLLAESHNETLVGECVARLRASPSCARDWDLIRRAMQEHAIPSGQETVTAD